MEWKSVFLSLLSLSFSLSLILFFFRKINQGVSFYLNDEYILNFNTSKMFGKVESMSFVN